MYCIEFNIEIQEKSKVIRSELPKVASTVFITGIVKSTIGLRKKFTVFYL